MDVLGAECAATSTGPGNTLMVNLLTTLLLNYCNTSSTNMWPDDHGPTAVQNKFDTYDFIVIGGGTAGSIVASRLAENPNQKVLLIEAGGDPPVESEIPSLTPNLHNTDYDWAYATKPNGLSCLGYNDENCPLTKGKVLGGTSTLNEMFYIRGNPHDYNSWEEIGNPMWDWLTVEKYFRLAENFQGHDRNQDFGQEGPLNIDKFNVPKSTQSAITRAAKDMGYPVHDYLMDGNEVSFGTLYGTLKDGRRMSTAKAYLQKKPSNLFVVKNAVAKKINFNANMKAESVTFVVNGKDELTADARKEVILSAGPIESPKLLMLSGIGPKTHLEALSIPLVQDLPVGDNLQDHTSVVLFLRFENQTKIRPTLLLDATYDQWIHQLGPMGMYALNLGAFINTNVSRKNMTMGIPDIQFVYYPINDIPKGLARYKLTIRQSIQHQMTPRDRLYAVNINLLSPQSQGNVRLASIDYKDKPIIFQNSLANEDDMVILVRGIRRQMEFQGTRPFRRSKAKFLKLDIPGCNEFPYRTTEYWRCYTKYMTSSAQHPTGTVKMGPDSDPTAVVDSHLRVKGVKGLRVIDASIMPKIVGADTNAATIMIGEKGADYVKSTWSMRTLIPDQFY